MTKDTKTNPNPIRNLSFHQLVAIIYQIVCALVTLEETGLVHADMKPENILPLGIGTLHCNVLGIPGPSN